MQSAIYQKRKGVAGPESQVQRRQLVNLLLLRFEPMLQLHSRQATGVARTEYPYFRWLIDDFAPALLGELFLWL